MPHLKHLENKIIDSFKEDFDGENSYLIIKFKGGGKINVVSFLNGDKGTAQLDIDTAKLSSQEIIGKKIKKFTETFDGESDHLKIHLEGGHVIEITPFSSNPESTASLDINVYSGDKVVAESLSENMYKKRGEYTMSQPQYESGERKGVSIQIRNYKKIFEWVMMKLRKEYDGVKRGTGGEGNYIYIDIEDPTASVEDVSDLLYKYIENGTVYAVDEI